MSPYLLIPRTPRACAQPRPSMILAIRCARAICAAQAQLPRAVYPQSVTARASPAALALLRQDADVLR